MYLNEITFPQVKFKLISIPYVCADINFSLNVYLVNWVKL